MVDAVSSFNVIDWLSGEPVFPALFRVVPKDECMGLDCLDLGRIYLLSFAVHWLVFVLIYNFSSIVSTSYRTLPFNDKVHWSGCFVSATHGLISGIASYVYTVSSELYEAEVLDVHNVYQDVFSAMTGGYLLYDLSVYVGMSLAGHKEFQSYALIIHHVIGSLGFPFLTNFPMSWVAGMWQVTELSSPFVNMRFVLSKAGYRNHVLYAINGIMMFVMFFFFRVVHLTNFWLIVTRNLPEIIVAFETEFVMTLFYLCTIAGTLLNVLWFYQVTKGIILVILKMMKKKGAKKGKDHDAGTKKAQ